MCGRYTNTASAGELSERLHLPIVRDEGTGRYNIAPTQEVLTVVRDDESLEARMLRWGLVPHWAKDTEGRLADDQRAPGDRCREAVVPQPRPEGLAPRAADRRRLLRVDQTGAPGGAPTAVLLPTRGRRAVRVRLALDERRNRRRTRRKRDDADLRFGEQPRCQRDPQQDAGDPARRGAREAWLDPTIGTEEALALCGPLPASRMQARPVTSAVNRVGAGAEGPAMLAPPERRRPTAKPSASGAGSRGRPC